MESGGEIGIIVALRGEAATARLAGALALLLRPGDLLALEGDLGAGKTAFARALLHALGWTDDVPSPTFTLVQTYDLQAGRAWHFDLYRIRDPAELTDLGWEEALSDIALVEWPDRAGSFLPKRRLTLRLEYGARPQDRVATLWPGAGWEDRLEALAALQRGGERE